MASIVGTEWYLCIDIKDNLIQFMHVDKTNDIYFTLEDPATIDKIEQQLRIIFQT